MTPLCIQTHSSEYVKLFGGGSVTTIGASSRAAAMMWKLWGEGDGEGYWTDCSHRVLEVPTESPPCMRSLCGVRLDVVASSGCGSAASVCPPGLS